MKDANALNTRTIKYNRLSMKTKTAFFLITVAAIFGTGQDSWAKDAASAATANRALIASPRTVEEFPWLARKSLGATPSTTRSVSAVSVIRSNRALAASPRMLEQFPELSRSGRESDSPESGNGVSQFAEVTRNRALAASPRMLEVFPQLARRVPSPRAGDSVEIAPLK
jgi:hypothetical protein